MSSPRGGGNGQEESFKVELLTSNESDNDQEDKAEEEEETEADDNKDYDQQDSGLLLHHLLALICTHCPGVEIDSLVGQGLPGWPHMTLVEAAIITCSPLQTAATAILAPSPGNNFTSPTSLRLIRCHSSCPPSLCGHLPGTPARQDWAS